MAGRFPLIVAAALATFSFAARTAPAPPASSLFSSSETISLQLKAAFNDLFEHARTDEQYVVNGTLSYNDGGRDVTKDFPK